MGDWQSIQDDAIIDMAYEEMNHKTEDDIRYDAFMLVDKDILEEYYLTVIDDYDLDSYMDKIEAWDKLSADEKIKYCYDLLYEDRDDDFPILRQVDIFQKLVNLDYKKFDYYEVLKCAFFDQKTLDDIEYKSNGQTTINIPFHPLIKDEFYKEYMSKLRKANPINSLSIPLDNTYNYLKDSLFMWYRHKHYDDTSYAIKELMTEVIDATTVKRRLEKIKLINTK